MYLLDEQPTREQILDVLKLTRGFHDPEKLPDLPRPGRPPAEFHDAAAPVAELLAGVLKRYRTSPWELLDGDALHFQYRGKVLVRRESSSRVSEDVGHYMGILGLEHRAPRLFGFEASLGAVEFRAMGVVETLSVSNDVLDGLEQRHPEVRAYLDLLAMQLAATPVVVDALRGLPPFAGARASHLSSLAAYGRLRKVSAGETLGGRGCEDVFYVLIEGTARVRVRAAAGKRPAVHQVLQNQGTWGFQAAMAGQAPDPAEAITDAVVIELTRMAVTVVVASNANLQRLVAGHQLFTNLDGLNPLVELALQGHERVLLITSPHMPEPSAELVLALAHQLVEDMNTRVMVVDGLEPTQPEPCLAATDDVDGAVVVRTVRVDHRDQDLMAAFGLAMTAHKSGRPFQVTLVNALHARTAQAREQIFAIPGFTRVVYLHETAEQWADLPWHEAAFPAHVVPVRVLPEKLTTHPILSAEAAQRLAKGLREAGGRSPDIQLPLDLVRVRLPERMRAPPGGCVEGVGLVDAGLAVNLGRLGRAATGRLVGLALGGGGALCMVHLALLEALAVRSVPIDVISGTSFGSVVGAYWAVLTDTGGEQLTADQVTDRLLGDWVWPQVMSMWSMVSTMSYRMWIDIVLGRIDLEQLELAFVPTCVEAFEGKPTPVTHGLVGHGVRASGSFPPTGPTVHAGKRLLDGAPSANVPVHLAEAAGAELIIASNGVARAEDYRRGVGRRTPFFGDLISEFNIVQRWVDYGRVILMMLRGANIEQTLSADLVYDPDLQGFSSSDFYKGRKIYESGRDAPQLPQVASRAAALVAAMDRLENVDCQPGRSPL